MTAALALTSCSSDTDEPIPEGGTIRFGAVIPGGSRVTPTTTTSISKFTVDAFTAGKPYMENVKVVRSGATWTYSPTMYWPTTPVNFYAVSPDITNSPGIGSDGLSDITGYTNNGNIDLLYAVSMNEMAREAPVQLNFRHAMSYLKIMLSCSNSDLTVKVGHVKLCNVSLRGDFTFPDASTSASSTSGRGAWTNLSMTSDLLTFYAMEESDAVTLTTTPTDLTENNLNIGYMLPQPLTELAFDGTKYSGSAIQIDCEMFDTSTGAKIWPTDATPSEQLVPDTGYGRLMYPLRTSTLTEWQQGYAYVYNIVIDNPSVLHPISFGVTVDEYTEFE